MWISLPTLKFIFNLDNPTCFNVLRAKPLEGTIILDLSPTIAYPLIDRLLGGSEIPIVARRPLAEVEHLIIRRVTNLFISRQQAWSDNDALGWKSSVWKVISQLVRKLCLLTKWSW